MDPAADSAAPRLERPTLAGILAMVFAAGFIGFLAVRGELTSSSSAAGLEPPASTSTVPKATGTGALGPVILDVKELKAQVRGLGQPVYWIGPRAGRVYELSRTTEGRVSVRYVRPGAPPGAADDRAIVIGTYPFENAYAKGKQAVKDSPALFYTDLPDGSLAVYDPDRPTSVYVAYRNVDYQIELFAPTAGQAQDLVIGGRIQRVR